MSASPSDRPDATLRVLGRHLPTGGLWVSGAGGSFVLHAAPQPSALGPLNTSEGPRWLTSEAPMVSLWALIVEHPQGLPETVAGQALLRLLHGSTSTSRPGHAEGTDPEAAWFPKDGGVPWVPDGGDGRVPWSQILRYLCLGELAHAPSHHDPPTVRAIEGLRDRDAVLSALVDTDTGGLTAVLQAMERDDVDVQDRQAGASIELLQGTMSDASTPPRVQVAKVALLTLFLGLATGWFMASPSQTIGARVLDLSVEGVSGYTLECGKARFLIAPASAGVVVPPGTCRVSVMIEGAWKGVDLDTARRLKYECRVQGGELACDEG